jgi:hypothetical protein
LQVVEQAADLAERFPRVIVVLASILFGQLAAVYRVFQMILALNNRSLRHLHQPCEVCGVEATEAL